MKVIVNGEEKVLREGETLEGLISSLLKDHRGVAAAVDGEVVPRDRWGASRLNEGQTVEVVTAVQGG
ncbi:MAG TPA: sulfur carrier protein ThiS [Actinomycetota bacterium]|nr:sulfur carrier protein ThiS [Actinomycetota bacterium]